MLLPLLFGLACQNNPETPVQPQEPDEEPGPDCPTTFTYEPQGEDTPDVVYVMGTFNNWDTRETAMEEVEPGVWEVTVNLPPGAHPYKMVEYITWSYDGYDNIVCDPSAELIHCPDGYKEPWQTDWQHDCAVPSDTVCNSMVMVADCSVPQVELSTLDIDRDAGRVTVVAEATPSKASAAIASVEATLDGEPVDVSWDGAQASLSLTGLSPDRHTLRVTATDDSGAVSEEAYVPFWMDAGGDDAWRAGSIYFAFVDRLADGDESRNGSEGTSAELGDFMGGDLQGVIDLLPYLDELGVKTLWLSNPQDNAEGAWAGQCEQTYAGYHAYWPDQAREVEEHFGDGDVLQELVDAAHDRNMRVIMDWVANHVHETHPYHSANPDWFNSLAVCKDFSGNQQNWDRIPEECWFAPYLPDIDYTQPEPLHVMVEDALWWARTYELDGFRVDAVKHMPHAVAWNLEARIRREIEHRHAGGDEQFWTVGETFDGYDRIDAYINRGDSLLGLDGQFDFPLYYTLQAVFGSMSADLSALEGSLATGRAVYPEDALMSSFLGNHDVMRFVSEATEGYQDACVDGSELRVAGLAWDPQIYTRMRLAWTFLFTQRDVPLVYYGDELGMPGYSDPDNRHPLWWYVDTDATTTVESVAAQLDGDRATLVRHVAALGRARQAHPALYRGQTVEWWRAPSDAPTLWAYARKDGVTGDEAIVILNRTGDEQVLSNGLSYAELTPGATFEDVLTGEVFTAEGDNLTVWVPGWASRVLVKR